MNPQKKQSALRRFLYQFHNVLIYVLLGWPLAFVCRWWFFIARSNYL
ncbi:MAG: hypothetical protein COB61_004520 [Thiotrichales bacterium]|nr:hypothetical protein [Thiotrichales bacterium]